MADTPFNAAEFYLALQRCSEDIKREVNALIPSTAEDFAARLRSRYPLGTKPHPDRPHMRDDISVRSVQSNTPDISQIRRVRGPRLATIWQNGTNNRTDPTRKNANRGRMPAADHGFFERTAVHVRRAMFDRAQSIMDRQKVIE